MYAILGAAGKVGYSTSSALRQAGVPVKAVLRDTTKSSRLYALGCDIAVADLQDPNDLAQAIAGCIAVQVICPPLPYVPDTADDMVRSIDSIVCALGQARPDLVLAISDYGAHVSDDIGMPTIFRYFEERLGELPIRKIFLRSAEHMEGWAARFPIARATGTLPTFHHPVEREFPTVSAHDVGMIAADLLLRRGQETNQRIVHVEGPRRYSAADVAAAFTGLLGRVVTAWAVPRGEWLETLGRVVSPSASELLVKLYDAHNRGGLVDVEPGGEVRYGNSDLIAALRSMKPAS
ncbi:NAD(P)H-binding protein (plasmid) [Ensifer sp. D2-11]